MIFLPIKVSKHTGQLDYKVQQTARRKLPRVGHREGQSADVVEQRHKVRCHPPRRWKKPVEVGRCRITAV